MKLLKITKHKGRWQTQFMEEARKCDFTFEIINETTTFFKVKSTANVSGFWSIGKGALDYYVIDTEIMPEGLFEI